MLQVDHAPSPYLWYAANIYPARIVRTYCIMKWWILHALAHWIQHSTYTINRIWCHCRSVSLSIHSSPQNKLSSCFCHQHNVWMIVVGCWCFLGIWVVFLGRPSAASLSLFRRGQLTFSVGVAASLLFWQKLRSAFLRGVACCGSCLCSWCLLQYAAIVTVPTMAKKKKKNPL